MGPVTTLFFVDFFLWTDFVVWWRLFKIDATIEIERWDPLHTQYDFEKGSFFLGLFVWNMLFAQV